MLREREQMECDTQPSLIQVCFLTERKEDCLSTVSLTLCDVQHDGSVTDKNRGLARVGDW